MPSLAMLSNLRIKTKLLLLNLMIYAAFLLIAGVIIISFAVVKNMLSEITKRDMETVICNSRTTREISKVFVDIDLLGRTFFRQDDYLKSEGIRLIYHIKDIAESVIDPDFNKRLMVLTDHLDSFLSQCGTVNTVLHTRMSIDHKTDAELTILENMISESLVKLTLEGKETSFVEQLLTLVVGYRESLLYISKLHAELEHEYFYRTLGRDRAPVIEAIDDLILRLQTITASSPEVV